MRVLGPLIGLLRGMHPASPEGTARGEDRSAMEAARCRTPPVVIEYRVARRYRHSNGKWGPRRGRETSWATGKGVKDLIVGSGGGFGTSPAVYSRRLAHGPGGDPRGPGARWSHLLMWPGFSELAHPSGRG
jgi:hypothetical protein